MRILNFFSRPEDPKCLKYQNVPNLGSFWAIGKPWERFQSGDIRIYFIPVPKDHTVVSHLKTNIAKGTTDLTVEFISQLLTQIWIKSNFKISIKQ